MLRRCGRGSPWSLIGCRLLGWLTILGCPGIPPMTPGMDGAEATISGAFDTTTYSVSYTPTDGGDPVTDHKWVVHEELDDPGEAPLAPGSEPVLNADHMSGMKGAEATIDSSTDETVYMVDFEMDGIEMTNHKWVVESELQPVS